MDAPSINDATARKAVNFNRLKECRHGRMLYNVNDAYPGRSLDLYGSTARGKWTCSASSFRAGDVVIEVGANVGAHTVALARIVGGGGMVMAFEPQRLAFQSLCANVALNNLANVWCHQAAFGDAVGHITVPDLDPRAEDFDPVLDSLCYEMFWHDPLAPC